MKKILSYSVAFLSVFALFSGAHFAHAADVSLAVQGVVVNGAWQFVPATFSIQEGDILTLTSDTPGALIACGDQVPGNCSNYLGYANVFHPLTLPALSAGTYYFQNTPQGNVVFTLTVVAVQRDVTPPVISHTVLNANYLVNASPVQFDFTATDTESGVGSVTATLDGVVITSPATLDFSEAHVGSHVISITAQDLAGNATSTTINYSVGYRFGGFLRPLKADGSGRYELGETLPVMFRLFDANGRSISTALATITVTNALTGETPVNGVAVLAPTQGDDRDEDHGDRDENDGRYTYKLRTKKLSVGVWNITVSLNDGSSYRTSVLLKGEND